MKPHKIVLERVDGVGLTDHVTVEVQGAMSAVPDPAPLEGVYESSLFMSHSQAQKLHDLLGLVLATIRGR